MTSYDQLKNELLKALDMHIDILKEVDEIAVEELPGFLFMMRSFGFMLDRAPKVLVVEDQEEMYYMMFQYYSLLTELKYNLTLTFPYATLQGEPLIEIVKHFPTTYEKEMKNWWEQKTGLVIEETKQTIEIKEFEY